MLFDLSAYSRPIPANVLVFASGANRTAEILGFSRLGIPLGVSVPHLKPQAIEAILSTDVPIMIDSGAFSEVMFFRGGCRTVAPIGDEEWQRRLSIYVELASALGSRAYLVAPDKVGDQQETIRRLVRYRSQLKVIAATGATTLLPLPVGEATHEDFLRMAEEAAEVHLTPSMPMRKAATSSAALMMFVERNKPSHIHLLGMGINNSRADRIIDAIRYLSPDTTISMDSNQLRSVIGRTRPLTRLETELRNSSAEDLFGCVDSRVLALNDELLDYTDLIAFPSLWASGCELSTVAAMAALSPADTGAFLEDPDTFLQSLCPCLEDSAWIEHPVMSFELDRAWQQHVMRKIASGVRSAAIHGVFRGSRIATRADKAA